MVEDSFGPILNTLASSLSKRSRGPSHKDASIDRALGAAASLGLSLAIIRLVVFAYKAAKRLEENNDDYSSRDGYEDVDDDNVDGVGDRLKIVGMDLEFATNAGSAFYTYIRKLLRRLLLDEFHDSNTTPSKEAGTVITHQGSCHCRSVQFEVLAPRCLTAKDGSGKIQYQHTRIPAECFTVVRGKEYLKTYHVAAKVPVMDDSKRGAHAFCGRCGVHVLFARSKNSSTVDINVHCLTAGIRKLRVTSTNDSISGGVALPGQWGKGDDDDHLPLSTISEGSSESPSRFLFHSPPPSSREPYKAYGTGAVAPQTIPAPVTPSTVSATDSCVSSIQLNGTDQDSSSLVETESVGSSSQGPAPPALSHTSSLPLDHRQDLPAASPALQNQMRYYMRKHLSSPLPSSSASSDTTTTGVAKEENDPH